MTLYLHNANFIQDVKSICLQFSTAKFIHNFHRCFFVWKHWPFFKSFFVKYLTMENFIEEEWNLCQKDKQGDFRLPQCQQKGGKKGQKDLEDSGFNYNQHHRGKHRLDDLMPSECQSSIHKSGRSLTLIPSSGCMLLQSKSGKLTRLVVHESNSHFIQNEKGTISVQGDEAKGIQSH